MAKTNDTALPPVKGRRRKYSSELAYIYVIQDDNGLIKIGHTDNPTRRLKQIQRACGFNIIHRHFSPLCYNAEQVENALQAEFGERLKQEEYVERATFKEVCEALDQKVFQTELPTVPKQRLLPFQFQKYSIRISIDQTGEVRFCLKDVCDALGIKNPSDVVKRLKNVVLIGVLCDLDSNEVTSNVQNSQPKVCDLDSNEVTSNVQNSQPEVCDLDSNEVTSKARKIQKMSFVDEPNLYRVIFRSNKQEAIVFQDWVFEEVLPSIRKMGYYSLYGKIDPSIQSMVNEVARTALETVTTVFAPLTKNPVIPVETQETTVTVEKVQVSFQVKLSFDVKKT